MSIIYSVVAYNQTVLVEYSGAIGNFPQITMQILPKLQKDCKQSYSYNNYVFHYLDEQSLTFICMSEPQFSKTSAYQFLLDVYSQIEKLASPVAYSFNSQFANVLKQKMDEHQSTNNKKDDKLNMLKQELHSVKDIMVQNIDQILEREQKVEILVKKTTSMSTVANTIKKQAVSIRRKQYWQNIRMKLMMGGGIIVAGYIVVSMFCGGLMLPNC